jgi:hypothetical protein
MAERNDSHTEATHFDQREPKSEVSEGSITGLRTFRGISGREAIHEQRGLQGGNLIDRVSGSNAAGGIDVWPVEGGIGRWIQKVDIQSIAMGNAHSAHSSIGRKTLLPQPPNAEL